MYLKWWRPIKQIVIKYCHFKQYKKYLSFKNTSVKPWATTSSRYNLEYIFQIQTFETQKYRY